MTTEYWLEAALTNDILVADLLIRMKHSKSSSDSLTKAHNPTPSSSSSVKSVLRPWGLRKNRSKSTPSSTTTATAAAAAVVGKEKEQQQQQRGSPTTHLSWSGGSVSDGCYEESSRPSDLSSAGGRSIKANEVASTSGYNKSHKRKPYDELKEVEGSLLKERIHINKELVSMRLNLSQQMVTSENLKRIKMDFDRNPRKEHEPESSALVKQSDQTSCRVEAETKEREKGFVLPDLNMTPCEEDAAMVS
ncbi:hypothetical protein OSB04_009716 [Centaurea solstitialis]|uniref:Uncharacterized protein n=1 Tax=Centaurea solstitialis TaxID=347529 RepID=A0AA38TP69_9ASTR|nr:hypothetical protein OSB04_009716 [Centaurea solstitialis]